MLWGTVYTVKGATVVPSTILILCLFLPHFKRHLLLLQYLMLLFSLLIPVQFLHRLYSFYGASVIKVSFYETRFPPIVATKHFMFLKILHNQSIWYVGSLLVDIS